MKQILLMCGLLALCGSAGASKKCGNSYIADNKTCRIGTSTPYVAPAPTLKPVVVVPISHLTAFGNCRDARAAGFANIARNSADYAAEFDRDNDGIACESGGDDDSPATALPAAQTNTNRTASCAAVPNTVSTGTPDPDGRVQARPVTVYEVQKYSYVSIEEFACSNGFSYRNDFGRITVSSPEHVLILDGFRNTLDGQPYTMTANVLSISGTPSAFYADVLNAFKLTVKGQKFNPIPATTNGQP